jgi:hypothetical protein
MPVIPGTEDFEKRESDDVKDAVALIKRPAAPRV